MVGTSWLTGSSGYLPANYVERTAETNTWTLHALVPLLPGTESPAAEESTRRTNSLERLMGAQDVQSCGPEEKLFRGVGRPGRESPAGVVGDTDEETAVSSTTPTIAESVAAPRQLYVVR